MKPALKQCAPEELWRLTYSYKFKKCSFIVKYQLKHAAIAILGALQYAIVIILITSYFIKD